MALRKLLLLFVPLAVLAVVGARGLLAPSGRGSGERRADSAPLAVAFASSELSFIPESSGYDMFCGPRCVQYILAQYGQKAQLPELIEEMQERYWRNGCSLMAVNQALNKRGIHTHALQVSGDTTLVCSTPMVVHLAPTNEKDTGHFVVQLPSTPTEPVPLWTGLAGVQLMDLDELRKKRSGAALLTSSKPIDVSTTMSVATIPLSWRFGLFLIAAVGLMLSIAHFPHCRSLLSATKRRQR